MPSALKRSTLTLNRWDEFSWLMRSVLWNAIIKNTRYELKMNFNYRTYKERNSLKIRHNSLFKITIMQPYLLVTAMQKKLLMLLSSNYGKAQVVVQCYLL